MHARKLRVSAVALLLALSSSGCLKLPWQRWSHWKAVRSKHITLYTDTKLQYAHTVETFELAHAAVGALPLFRGHDVAPVEVLFLGEPEYVATFGRLRGGVTIAQVPGEGRLGQHGLIVVLEDTGIHEAAHRLMHLFLHARMPRSPLWMHEAFATYFENVRYAKDEKGTISCFGYLGPADKLMPLGDLFNLRWEDYDNSGKGDWYRRSGALLLDYLYMGDEGKFRSAIPIVIGRTASGGSAVQALGAALPGVSVEQIDEHMRDFRKSAEMHPRPLCPLSVPVPPELQADTGERQIETVSEEDIKSLGMRIRLVPHRSGRVDWYPPEAVTLAAPAETPPAPAAAVQGSAP
jgi:hypothetical protein